MKKATKRESFGGTVACDNCEWTGQFDEVNGNCPECGSDLVEVAWNPEEDPQMAGDNKPGNVTVVNQPVYAQQTHGYPATGQGSRGRDDSGDDVIFPKEEGAPAGWESNEDIWLRPLLFDDARALYEDYGDEEIPPMAAVKSLTINDTISLSTELGEIVLAKDATGRYVAMIEPSVELAVMINNFVKPVGTPPDTADRMVEDAKDIFKQILAGADIKDALKHDLAQEGAVSDWLVKTVESIMSAHGLKGERSWARIHDSIMNNKNVKVGDSVESVMAAVFTPADIRQLKKTDMFESKIAQEARSSTIRLSTLDVGDELLLTLKKPMGKIVAGLVTVTKMKQTSAKAQGAAWVPVKPADFTYKINDRFGNEVTVDYQKAMEVLR